MGVQRVNHGFDPRKGIIFFVFGMDPKHVVEGQVRISIGQDHKGIVGSKQFGEQVGFVRLDPTTHLLVLNPSHHFASTVEKKKYP
tara:strand:- start:186 stop:440 length:255 start_codon:yes stop_codon:yes gene_type:complete